MSELLNQTIADINRALEEKKGTLEAHYLSEIDWHKLRSEIAMKEGSAPGDPDYPLMNFYLNDVRVCIRAPIMEEDDGA